MNELTIASTGVYLELDNLIPSPDCDTCDVDNDYVCFYCECEFINLLGELNNE